MRPVLSIAACLLLVPLVAAQDHANGHAFVAGRSNPVAVGLITPGAKLTTLLPTASLPLSTWLYRGCMDVDNLAHVLAFRDGGAGGGILRLSPTGPPSTIAVFPYALFPQIPGDVTVDQDGNYTVCIQMPAQPALMKVDRQSGAISTLLASPLLASVCAFTRDVESGDLFAVTRQRSILRLDLLARAVTSLTTLGAGNPLATPDLTREISSGALLATQHGQGIMRVDRQGRTTLILSGLPHQGAHTLAIDRTSSRDPRLVCHAMGYAPLGNHLYAVSLTSTNATVILATPALIAVNDVYFNRGRSVSTILRGSRYWEVALSFPGHGGLAYVLALGFSGTRPGFMVGRRWVALNPDALTTLSVLDRLVPVATGTLGRLDASGRGTARIRLGSLPPLGGARLHMVALVLDPSAPHSIRTISDPVLMRLP